LKQEVRKIVRQTGLFSGVVAVALSPVPLADEAVLLPTLAFMAARIGRAHGVGTLELPWRRVASATLAALGARATVNLAVSYMPGVAAAANAVTAIAMTQWLGAYVDRACTPLGDTTIGETA
jgi:uncharacterized protein (DUF697 family)